MEQAAFEKAGFLKTIIDTVPSMMFIVDEDVRIHFANAAALAALRDCDGPPYKKRGGDALHCINSQLVPEGCGRAEPCKECVVRNSVGEAFGGKRVSRKNTFMQLRLNGVVKDIHLSVSASLMTYEGEDCALLLLEDISELMDLRSILPICMHCKKIRSDDGYWQKVEKYFHAHTGVDFSHSICPECIKKFYPRQYSKISNGVA